MDWNWSRGLVKPAPWVLSGALEWSPSGLPGERDRLEHLVGSGARQLEADELWQGWQVWQQQEGHWSKHHKQLWGPAGEQGEERVARIESTWQHQPWESHRASCLVTVVRGGTTAEEHLDWSLGPSSGSEGAQPAGSRAGEWPVRTLQGSLRAGRGRRSWKGNVASGGNKSCLSCNIKYPRLEKPGTVSVHVMIFWGNTYMLLLLIKRIPWCLWLTEHLFYVKYFSSPTAHTKTLPRKRCYAHCSADENGFKIRYLSLPRSPVEASRFQRVSWTWDLTLLSLPLRNPRQLLTKMYKRR